jgi:hypothetical protein
VHYLPEALPPKSKSKGPKCHGILVTVAMGPSYRLGVWLPGCRLLRGRGLGVGPQSSDSLV